MRSEHTTSDMLKSVMDPGQVGDTASDGFELGDWVCSREQLAEVGH